MRHYHYPAKGRFLGFYYGTAPVLSVNPEGCAGDWFLNGETLSVWMWDTVNRVWIDTNRVDAGLQRMLTDKTGNSPADCVPSPEVGIKEAYFYVAENADCDNDEAASPRNITFTHFKNGNVSVSVEVRKTSIIILYWNGDYWETSVVPMNVDLSLYAKDAALQAEITRAKAAEAANAGAIASETVAREAAITALSPQLLKGTLYLSSDSTALYTDEARQQEYRQHDAVGAGIWHVKGSDIRGLLIQGWTHATLYPHNAGYLLHWKWDAAQEKWVWESDPKRYAVTQAEKSAWNSAVSRLDDFLTSADATDTAINKWKELESFLSGITDTETLAGLLYEQETRLGASVSAEQSRAEAAEAANAGAIASETAAREAAITALSPQLLKGTLYLSSDSTALYTDEARQQEYRQHDAVGAGIWHVKGSDIRGLLIQGWTQATLYPHNVGYLLYWKWDAAQEKWVWESDPKRYAVTQAEKSAWNSAVSRLDDFLTSADATDTAINKWKELESFLSGITDTETLAGLLYEQETRLGASVSAEQSRAEAAEAANAGAIASETAAREAAITALSPQLLKGTLYLSADSTALYTDEALQQEYRQHDAAGAGIWHVKGSNIRGLLIQGWTQATLYPHNAGYLLYWKWDAAQEKWVWESDPKRYAVTQAEKSAWNSAVSRLDDFLTSADATDTAINKWKELESFLSGITDTETLAGLLYEQETRLGASVSAEQSRAEAAEESLQDKIDGLAAVATSGSYNDLKDRPSLAAVATSGSYGSLSNRPLQGKITLASADGLYYSSQNGVYVVEDGGTTQGLLFFSTVGNGGLQQYLLQDGAIKSRTGTYTAGIPEWNGWQAQEAVPGTQKTLYIDSATPVNGQGDVEIDFAAEFDTIYFGASKPWAIKSVPDAGSGKEVIRKNVITASGIIPPPRYSGSSSSATVAINGETYGFTSDVVVITSISAYAGPYVSLTAAKESHTILGRRIEQSNLTCYELWLEVDHDAKTVAMTLIPKY